MNMKPSINFFIVSIILCLLCELVMAQTPNKYKEKDNNRVSVIKEFQVRANDRKTVVLSGKLIDESGNPIALQKFAVGFESGNFRGYIQTDVFTDSEGNFNTEIVKDLARNAGVVLLFSDISDTSVSNQIEKGEKITVFNPARIVYKYDSGTRKIVREDAIATIETRYGREVLGIKKDSKESDSNIIVLRIEDVFSNKNKDWDRTKQEAEDKQDQFDLMFYNRFKALQLKPEDENEIFEFIDRNYGSYKDLIRGVMRISQVIGDKEVLMYGSDGSAAHGKLMPSCVKRDFRPNTSYQVVAVRDGIYEYITADGFKNKVNSFKIYAIKQLQYSY